MNVSLTDEQRRFISKQLKNGRYQNAAEVIREGLRRLMDEEEARKAQLDELRNQIAQGFRSAKSGKLRDGAEIVAELREFLSGRKTSK